MIFVAIVLAAFAAYLSAYVFHQLLMFAANAFIPDSPECEPTRQRRFNVLVPAHDEELYLPRLLVSLASQEYPKTRYRVTVVADNCTDDTVAASRTFNIDVLERTDTTRRGKGYAIRWALERIDLARFDAVVIVDGDSTVDPGFLKHLNLQMERGDSVIQCSNGVANPEQSWFTRLMDVSRTIANDIVNPGKRKLGLSCHLMGNGMCFDVGLISRQGWHAFSVGEDWEYYARLILGGTYVGYSKCARVHHQESVNLRQASSQRIRWSSGRFQVLRLYGPRLFVQAVRTRSLKCLDASLPILFPNPSLGINLTFAGLTLAAMYWFVTAHSAPIALYALLALLQLFMFIVGICHTEHKAANATSLALAPVFLVWKLGIDVLSVCGIGAKEWKRTERRLN